MRKLSGYATLFCLVIAVTGAWAQVLPANGQIFGIQPGMLLKDLQGQITLVDRGHSSYFSHQAPRPDNRYSLYGYTFDKSSRLCGVWATRNTAHMDATQIQLLVQKMSEDLSEHYGEPRSSSDGITLLWTRTGQATLPNGFEAIALKTVTSDEGEPSVVVAYSFHRCD